ncbi:hypothetical protein D9619_012740 [Psilocybe cf. subviscida]|uniref:Uncharacterized protein n=1 Tax=Psilocybe cf. subviscida TaxID=2480587 RepID=A0A8H5AQ73_9AGAR|nr:hypothetical protein D9619_012740 [Psilocybe cf. subviscida]
MASREYPRKRARIEPTSKPRSFSNASEIISSLQTDNVESLTEALIILRNQLAVKTTEGSVSPQDVRLELVKEWIQRSHGASDLFTLWDTANSRQSTLIALILSVLSSILTLLSAHYTDHALGQPVIKNATAAARLRQLNSYIGGSHNELILCTLKLYNVMSSFASGKDRKTVLEGFGWEIKSLPKLLNMRRKTHGDKDTTDPLTRPDIRTLYILLLLSFVEPDTPTQTKIMFLEQHREAFLAIFKGIANDHYSLARRVLEVCWAGVWSDAKMKRTLKVGLFNETTLGHLFKLYDRIQSEDDDEDHVPANLVHHFLLAICTRPGTGICFKDRGWYPRETEEDELVAKEDEENRRKSGKIYNKILANILKTLKVNEDSRQQELALKIIAACPELVAGYWPAVALTLEPRLSSKWITNIAIFGNIISLPLPTSSFYMPNSTLYQPTPPPLSTIIENILPSVGTKNNFSKGLQSPAGLVQHCSALALARCLVKYQLVDEQFRKVSEALEESETEGQWAKRRRELERDVRRRVPDFQVIVAFSQQKQTNPQGEVNHTKVALLAESAQRLLWLYHRCLPAVVAEARFDVGKLLQTFVKDESGPGSVISEAEDVSDSASRLYRVQQLHVLSLLQDSDQFLWTGKIASLPYTPFRILLNALVDTKTPAIRVAVVALIQHILSQSILFQEDRQEPSLWVDAFPARQANTDRLRGEVEGVLSFIDDCVQRCLKTPYRYIEALHALAQQSSADTAIAERLDELPSPLVMAVIEQFDAQSKNNSLQPHQCLGVVAFIRKLLVNLAKKTADLCFIYAYAHKIDEILLSQQRLSESQSTASAIRREMDILYASLSFSSFATPMVAGESPELSSYLNVAEQTPIPESKALRAAAASEVIDWMRTSRITLGPTEVKRLVALISSLDTTMLSSVLENLIPGQIDLWEILELESTFSDYRRLINFDTMYLHTGAAHIIAERCQVVLAESVFARGRSLVVVTRAVRFIMHGIAATRQQDGALHAQLSLLARVVKTASTILAQKEFEVIKDIIFVQPSALREIMMAPQSSHIGEGIVMLLKSIMKSTSPSDRKVLSGISDTWFNMFKAGSLTQDSATIATGCIWTKYLESAQLFELLDVFEEEVRARDIKTTSKPMDVILDALCSTSASDWRTEQALTQKLPRLVALKRLLPDSSLLEQVLAVAIDASVPIGIDGCPGSLASPELAALPEVTGRVEARWSHRHHSVTSDLDVRPFLFQEIYHDSTIKIIVGLLHRQASSRRIVGEWLGTDNFLQRTAIHLVPIIHAFLESVHSRETTPPASSVANTVWLSVIPGFVEVIADETCHALGVQARYCLLNILSAPGASSSKLLDAIAKAAKALPAASLHSMIPAASDIVAKFGSKADTITSLVVDSAMQSCIDEFVAKSETPESKALSHELASLVKRMSNAKPHLVETLLTVIIQSRYHSISALQLAVACLSNTPLKPLIVNRLLQNVIQHPHFFKICGSSSTETAALRVEIIELLHVLFHLHPHNTCQITHIEPLIRVYKATLSQTDLRILSIFQLFEGQRKLSTTAILSRWSSTPNVTSNSALEALQSLDPIVVLRTCLNFPRWRKVEDQSSLSIHPQEAVLYDPIFIMLLFSQMMADQQPVSAFQWIELFRTNMASLFIRALSAKNGEMRDLAMCQVIALWRALEHADLQEKPHVLYILNLLKDLFTPPTMTDAAEPPRQLPTYTTLLLMHALRAIFSPSNFIYPVTARFLLQRPTLDTTDVPMLFGMLYSSSDDNWKKERGWMIRFLADGMVGSEDWRVLKRRHTWDLLASLFQSSDSADDNALRLGVLEVLANITCNAQATSSLILKSALLPWIETQLLQGNTAAEGVEWIKILENIIVIVDHSKIEAGTNGEWRTIICKCLTLLLNDKICSASARNFPHAVQVILRLSLLSGPPVKDLPRLLELAVQCLEKIEAGLLFNPMALIATITEHETSPVPSAPHRSLTLHERVDMAQAAQDVQQRLIITFTEMLWRASMTLRAPATGAPTPWEKLTPRLLLWHSVRSVPSLERNGKNAVKAAVDPAEWARKEVLASLGEAKA